MRQAFHIFRKDVRHLWLQILIVLVAASTIAVTAARAAWSPAGSSSVSPVATGLLTILLPVAWWALIERLIHAEPLVGDRQFWVTRPYAWKSLLAAKALFAGVFVNLVKLAMDVVVLWAHGFQPGAELGGLVWTQVLLTAGFVLPVAALSALTAGIVPFLAATFLLVLAVVGWSLAAPHAPWLALEWVRTYSTGLVVAIAAVVIVWRQYSRKGGALTRLLAGASLLAAFTVLTWLPWKAAFALQSRFSTQTVDPAAVRVDFDPARKWAVRAFVDRADAVVVEIPLRVGGVPSPLRLRPEGIVARIEGPGGAVWRARQHPRDQVRSVGDFILLRARVDASFYRRVGRQPVWVRGTLYLTLYGNPRGTVLPVRDTAGFVPAPGAGLCSATRTVRGILVNCRSAFRSRPDSVLLDFLKESRDGQPMSFYTQSLSQHVSYSPFPAEANLLPVTQSAEPLAVWGQTTAVRVYATEPVAHIRREFEIGGLRLADFEAKQ